MIRINDNISWFHNRNYKWCLKMNKCLRSIAIIMREMRDPTCIRGISPNNEPLPSSVACDEEIAFILVR